MVITRSTEHGPPSSKRAATQPAPTVCGTATGASSKSPKRQKKAHASSATVSITKRFHGQLRSIVGYKAPGTPPPNRLKWPSGVILTKQVHLAELLDSVNEHTYSMTSGKGGAPIAVPLKKAKIDWRCQAVLVFVSESPYAQHSLQIHREAPNRYSAVATQTAKGMGSAPRGLVSFDACIFDLAPEDEPAAGLHVALEGVTGDLVSGPQWE